MATKTLMVCDACGVERLRIGTVATWACRLDLPILPSGKGSIDLCPECQRKVVDLLKLPPKTQKGKKGDSFPEGGI